MAQNKVDWNDADYQPSDSDLRLDELFRSYREACPEPETSVNFMPDLWAKIEAREASTNLFGRMAKALVTAALAASVILALMVSTLNQVDPAPSATYIEALTVDHASTLEPFNLER
ncbi:MAG TPA: hypothetical protein VHB50_20300, partial [Bryobacteraceae bacterium]|nr:hypothetical protein [Bryobacteraceae bacterium]